MSSTKTVFGVGLLALPLVLCCVASQTMQWLEGCQDRATRVNHDLAAHQR